MKNTACGARNRDKSLPNQSRNAEENGLESSCSRSFEMLFMGLIVRETMLVWEEEVEAFAAASDVRNRGK